MLWIGWFGFNGGSALTAGGNAGMALLVTHISASAASLIWMIIDWIKFGRPSLVGMVTGMVAGLATVTPASGYIGIPGGIILGLIGGYFCYVGVDLIRNKLKIDDSLDVFAVHGIGGMIGSILVSILATDIFSGLGLNDGMTIVSQIYVQILCVLITIIWTAIGSFLILKSISFFMSIRVNEDLEVEGLDMSEHGEKGYHSN